MNNEQLEEIHSDLTQISEQLGSIQRAFDVLIGLMRKYEINVLDKQTA